MRDLAKLSTICLLDEDELAGAPESLVGGKARQLGALVARGARVPELFCVPTPVFDALVAKVGQPVSELLATARASEPQTVVAASSAARRAIQSLALDAIDQTAILHRFDSRFPKGSRVAVRSSAVGEDSASDSFAGQLDTFLHVPRAELCRAIVDCFASAFTERALMYRLLRGHGAQARVAVVVQCMVEARAAGVIFTANPTTGDRSEAVISAALGLGEGVVDGTVETDTFYAELATGRIRRSELACKQTRVVFDDASGSGTAFAEVAAPEQNEAAIDEAQLQTLVLHAAALADQQGSPQDIEWALDQQGTLYLLQSRPITTLPAADAHVSVFDNANIVESHPGLTLPLTFSFVRRGYEKTFREAQRCFGVSEEVLRQNRDLHENLVAMIDGRMYYNLRNWYRIYEIMPGFAWALPAWEEALGLDALGQKTEPLQLSHHLRRVPAYGELAVRLMMLMRGLERQVGHYLRRLDRVQQAVTEKELDALSIHELVALLDDVTEELTAPYAIAVVNDFFTQQLYGLVKALIVRWQLGEPETLRNELLCGEHGVDSVAPVRSLVALSQWIAASPAALALFQSAASHDEVWRQLISRPEHAVLYAALTEHIAKYGDRVLHELKLDSPLIEEQPGFLVQMLRNYLATEQCVEEMEARERTIRNRAEAHVRERLRRSPIRRRIFFEVLARARAGVRFRENLRLARSRSYGLAKRMFRALGRQFVHADLLDDSAELLYLTVEEAIDAVRGASVTDNLRNLVELRREEYAVLATRSAPADRILRRGAVLARADVQLDTAIEPAAGDDDLLRGTGCSSGRVRAPAKILLEPSGDLSVRGEILVAPMTDPGWVFLMVSAGGLVAEKGSVLSHTAIIGRELGIPTIVGVKGATSRIQPGDEIELDGRTGEVRIHRPSAVEVNDAA